MWVTGHPFSLNRWSNLRSASEVQAACAKHPEYLGDEAFSKEHAELLAKRLWLLLLPARLEEMTMSRAFLGSIRERTTMSQP